jgi:hypothetical protein
MSIGRRWALEALDGNQPLAPVACRQLDCLPAIRQQRSLTSLHAAPCRFIAIFVLSSIDTRQRVDAY